ncbi:hypothetical protein VNO78_07275 [Psophocarpus tetragonolobus]|uniref:Uncharacterized protein n=1 Tax=Psophocarpus tetragonolobus TaxID=3891 RepID=A0AAN9SUD5_PSOTE
MPSAEGMPLAHVSFGLFEGRETLRHGRRYISSIQVSLDSVHTGRCTLRLPLRDFRAIEFSYLRCNCCDIKAPFINCSMASCSHSTLSSWDVPAPDPHLGASIVSSSWVMEVPSPLVP